MRNNQLIKRDNRKVSTELERWNVTKIHVCHRIVAGSKLMGEIELETPVKRIIALPVDNINGSAFEMRVDISQDEHLIPR